MTRLSRIALLVTLLFAWGLQVGCSTNAATGRRQFLLVSRAETDAMGAEAAPQLTAEYGGAVGDVVLSNYVADIGNRMAATTEADYPTLDWQFTLLDSDVINAFALPGGRVFISRGLAERFTNEAQLAAVIGHEIGHVTANHVGERISRSVAVSVASGLLSASASENESTLVRAAVPLLVGAGGQGYLLRFGREQELEADKLGVRYMVNLDYDPRGARQVQEILAGAGAPRSSEWLSTHPYPDTRIDQIDELLAGQYAYTQSNPQYQLRRDRFQSEFKPRLSALPPAAHARGVQRFAHAHDAFSWCAVCASK